MNIEKLVSTLKDANKAYRDGNPILTDNEYDEMLSELKSVDPNNPFLRTIEPETQRKKEVRHSSPMLSIEKAYKQDELEKFFNRVDKASVELNISKSLYRITAKLDGVAGRDEDGTLATRGNGTVGNDITDAYDKGLITIGGLTSPGIGEVVMVKDYFEKEMSEEFTHPRNLVAGMLNSDDLNVYAKKALDDGMIHFVPYTELEDTVTDRETIVEGINDIYASITNDCIYPTDGIVITATDERIRAHMGSTSHSHRWQIAYKKKGETAETTINSITWQVGRTGTITPVLEVEPVKLSGATIRRVTAHNAGIVLNLMLGQGATITIIRSGEVIPKIEDVIEHAESVVIPDKCPSCKSHPFMIGDFLKCKNIFCKAQVVKTISHWFDIIETDWFGPKAVEKLVSCGYDSVGMIYGMEHQDFNFAGFGDGEAKRLVESIKISLTKPVEDWRFLASFGIPDLGRGDSKKLLQHHNIGDITTLDQQDIIAIDGFGEITSNSVADWLEIEGMQIREMMSLGFNLIRTPHIGEEEMIESPISGKKIVFTGKMTESTRDEMKNEAAKLGAVLQSGVSSKTDILVVGEKAGGKLTKAQDLGITILTEQEYYTFLSV